MHDRGTGTRAQAGSGGFPLTGTHAGLASLLRGFDNGEGGGIE